MQNCPHALRITVDDHEIGAVAAKRAGAPLLPVFDLGGREPEVRREVALRQRELGSNRLHVDFRGNIEACRLGATACNLEGLGETRLDLLKRLGAHCYAPLLASVATLLRYSATMAFVMSRRRLLSDFDKFDFSPFPNTVIRNTGKFSPVMHVIVRYPPRLPLPRPAT